MKLQHPFPLEVRLLYLNWWECFLCGENGQRSGGLEIHHILGRVSGCAFNSSCLCKKCHSHIGHSREEQQEIFLRTMKFLKELNYQPSAEDLEFFQEHSAELYSKKLDEWLSNRNQGTNTEQEE